MPEMSVNGSVSCDGDFKCRWCKGYRCDEPTDKHSACEAAELQDEINRLTTEGAVMREALESILPRRDGAAHIAEQALARVSSSQKS